MLPVMTRDLFHGGVCSSVKEMSPFILEENVLYKLPLTLLSLRQQSLRTGLRIHVKAEPLPH